MDWAEQKIYDMVQRRNTFYLMEMEANAERQRLFSHFDENDKPVYRGKLTKRYIGWPGNAKEIK